ncbi:GatB/YqeY domain-containing protein [Pullulanibacillus sp. KACC 23026]|uniref:GatB/YqeY domain-containing protein n=1 Tax=Pullulanibacillus sp. KACC 23026 TaxID=3028315 RepID=UPI0023AFAD52|nr:GatB/YqeY domain-containing protein [Pullulanibacillus sp. KACC 23026]WEG14229.1 GatB/YqeY domain-containing protein [Pullulanibacillus sp. KACC 23026]
MSFLDQLTQDMKEAMKAKDKERLSVIRMLKASLQNESIKLGKDLSEDEALTVLSRELKQRNDSLQEFEQAGREDLAEKTRSEILVVKTYLPEPLTDDQLENVVKETIQEVGASSKADMGKVMQALMPKVKGRADGGKVSRLVQEHLS